MAGVRSLQTSKKRKDTAEDDGHQPEPELVKRIENLEMLSEDEGDEDAEFGSDDGEVDEFPEIDPASDSEEGEEEEDESEDSYASDSDSDDLGIFPKAKTIVSDITGQPKKVYPEIEPDYDSDSSTEEVCVVYSENYNSEGGLGSKSCRKYTYALVRRSAACRL
jgi:ribosome biogenesis protein ERB1